MSIQEIIKNRLFWMASILLTAVIFVVTVNASKVFEVQTTILFLPKTELTARNINQIIANAEQISLSHSFLDTLAEKNIKTAQIGKSGMLSLSVMSETQIKAEALSQSATSGLLATMSKYYNIKTDLDMRIVDGPIVSRVIKINIWLLIFLSLLLGFAIGFLFTLFSIFLTQKEESVSDEPTDFQAVPVELPKVSFSETRVKKNDNLSKMRNIFNFDTEEVVSLAQPKKDFVVSEKKAAAPANLPISEEAPDFNFSTEVILPTEPIVEEIKEIKPVETMIAESTAIDTTREATSEEVKARLNKLLSGDMLK